MRYRTKVTVVTGGREYKPGTILPEDISKGDLAFLKSKGFVDPVDMAPAAAAGDDEADPDDEGGDFSGFDEREPEALKSPDEIRKFRSKKDVFNYAASIGFSLGENHEEKSLKALQEEVINFQEEKLEDGAEGEPEGE